MLQQLTFQFPFYNQYFISMSRPLWMVCLLLLQKMELLLKFIRYVGLTLTLCHAINVNKNASTHFKWASLCPLSGRFLCRCSTMVSLSIHMIRMPLQMHCINFFPRSNFGQGAEKKKSVLLKSKAVTFHLTRVESEKPSGRGFPP